MLRRVGVYGAGGGGDRVPRLRQRVPHFWLVLLQRLFVGRRRLGVTKPEDKGVRLRCLGNRV